jgi:hypothetical protein
MPRTSRAISELSPSAVTRGRLVGDHIHAAIRARGTLSAFAERVGVSRSSLRKIIDGDPSIPFGMVVAVLDALGMVDHLDQVAAPERDTLGQSLRLQTRRGKSAPRLDNDF